MCLERLQVHTGSRPGSPANARVPWLKRRGSWDGKVTKGELEELERRSHIGFGVEVIGKAHFLVCSTVSLDMVQCLRAVTHVRDLR